jgi:hypothetical protein
MPRFFFDFNENGATAIDLEGLDLASPDLARTEALSALAEMARDAPCRGEGRSLVCTVRDGDGAVHRLELTVRCVPLH